MIRFLGNNYNKEQLLQLLSSLDEAFVFAIRCKYDDIVTHDIGAMMTYIGKLYKALEAKSEEN